MARIETIRLVVGIENNNNWFIYQVDVKYVFSNGPLEEEVYVSQPLDFILKNQESMFYILRKVLYGMKQTPRGWNKKNYGFIKEIGFDKCVSGHGVHVNKDTSK